jgi:hypothetical protein
MAGSSYGLASNGRDRFDSRRCHVMRSRRSWWHARDAGDLPPSSGPAFLKEEPCVDATAGAPTAVETAAAVAEAGCILAAAALSLILPETTFTSRSWDFCDDEAGVCGVVSARRGFAPGEQAEKWGCASGPNEREKSLGSVCDSGCRYPFFWP